ncbi:MAG TPA: glycerophosphodiester phosphodiesterase family protein, partial [Bacillota bacterium]|nr:glycerophosphodiester phosphodiesterase family protein [Bacillota bacterium]
MARLLVLQTHLGTSKLMGRTPRPQVPGHARRGGLGEAALPGQRRASRWLVWLLLGTLCLPGKGTAAVLSIGHRGNALFAPENTVASFTAARGKADLMELDAQLTSDGQFVVMHDSTVDRTTDGTGQIATQTLAGLKQWDAGSWFAPQFTGERIPTLAEAIQAIVPFATPLIEQKAGGAASYVAELRRLNAVTNVIVQSFDWNFLTAVHALEPNLRLGALGSGKLTAATLTSIRNAGATLVAWEKSGIASNELAMVHGAGLTLFVWTVDGPEIQTFLDLGADGIISNDPGLVKTLQQPATINPASLGDRLVSYWRLDDGLTNMAVTKVADSKGTNAGSLLIKDGQAHWQSASVAKFGGCLRVDGTNASVDIPNSTTLDINTNALTLSAWVKLRDLPSGSPEAYGSLFDSVQD